MSKRRIQAITSVFLTVFYLLFISLHLYTQAKSVRERYEDYENYLYFETDRLAVLSGETDMPLSAFTQYVDGIFDYSGGYGSTRIYKAYALYDNDTKSAVSTNCFMVEIDGECYLNSNRNPDRMKYKKELREKWGSTYEDYLTVDSVEYYEQDGKRVYTAVTIRDTEISDEKTDKTYTMKLSEPKGKVQTVKLFDRSQLNMDTKLPEEFENVPSRCIYYHFLDENDPLSKEFIYIDLHLDAVFDEYFAEISDFADGHIMNGIMIGSVHSGKYKGFETHRVSDIKLDGRQYSLIYVTYYNPLSQAIWFTSDFIGISWLFLILALLVVSIIPRVYEKNKLYEQSRSAFTAAAAHELKTPIAVIANSAECIMENVSPEKNEKYVRNIYDESLRMGRLVNSLMQYNRLSSGKSVRMRKCNLSEITLAEVEKYRTVAEEKGVDIQTDICKKARVKADSELIALVIDNYLSNAVKHTQKGDTIKISLQLREIYGSFRLSVFNEGEQIPAEHIDKIWNVLYRADEVRNSEDNSSGMGLAISKQILEIHKCVYGAINKADGVEFYFDLKQSAFWL
ncbi:MAG: HAMP domain-containing histidine kinase [Ruminococcaceae bacterium]|nr:HAMP domain-containing histidine kinase [Oscillospiraceae bacterium]